MKNQPAATHTLSVDESATILIGDEKCPAILAANFDLVGFVRPKYADLIVKAVNRDHLFDELVGALTALVEHESKGEFYTWGNKIETARAVLARMKP